MWKISIHSWNPGDLEGLEVTSKIFFNKRCSFDVTDFEKTLLVTLYENCFSTFSSTSIGHVCCFAFGPSKFWLKIYFQIVFENIWTGHILCLSIFHQLWSCIAYFLGSKSSITTTLLSISTIFAFRVKAKGCVDSFSSSWDFYQYFLLSFADLRRHIIDLKLPKKFKFSEKLKNSNFQKN